LALALHVVAAAASSACAAQPITISPSATPDTIAGFGAYGAAVEWQAAGPHWDSAFVEQTVGGLGLTIIRDDIPSDFEPVNDNGDPNVTNMAGFNLAGGMSQRLAWLAALKRAANRHGSPLRVVATVFSPPAWMKTNADTVNGGSLRADCREEFAEYCAVYLRTVRDSTGIEVYGLSLQSEPTRSLATASCTYTAAVLGQLLRTRTCGWRLRGWGLS